MDNTREALRLITSENYDIHKAVEFCKVILNSIQAECLKISEKVAFNIASEASYVYILMTKIGCFFRPHQECRLLDTMSCSRPKKDLFS